MVSPRPLPTYPDGFPSEVIEEFERRTGRGTLCNKPYSGTQLILDYGREHEKTGSLIVYTSADSVVPDCRPRGGRPSGRALPGL